MQTHNIVKLSGMDCVLEKYLSLRLVQCRSSIVFWRHLCNHGLSQIRDGGPAGCAGTRKCIHPYIRVYTYGVEVLLWRERVARRQYTHIQYIALGVKVLLNVIVLLGLSAARTPHTCGVRTACTLLGCVPVVKSIFPPHHM